MAPPAILSRLRFGAFLIYAPNGTTPNSRRSKNFVVRVKNDKGHAIAGAIDELKKRIAGSGLEEFLGPDVALVPAPRSNPIKEGALWPARRVCEELVRVKLGREAVPCLHRKVPVSKSAFAGPGARPKVADQVASIEGNPSLRQWKRLTIVDDVVTSGSTLLAGASHLKELFPDAEIAAFGLVRTMSDVTDLGTMYVPDTGEILFEEKRGTARRRP